MIQRRHFTYSAWNLAFYLALRCHDLRKIQRSLLPFGLSSLGRGEARAITNLDAVMASLGRICQEPEQNLVPYPQQRRFFYGDGLLAYNTGRIFGTAKTGTRIMVTLPTEAAEDNGLLTKPLGGKIKNEKSLNFPQTPMNLSPLTEKDKEDLDFVVQYADAIGYSFVKSAADVSLLQGELQKRCGKAYRQIALVAKIENQEAVDNLPEIIVQAASKQPLGIMIARGDLAVEVGYRRLAELQEEIMWICEAAHVPVIWATQVLENLVKKGLPSRAEITDAAMGERAECVMLNKGPYIVEAVTALTNILLRMEQHQHKKTSQLRALHIAQNMFENGKL